MVSLAWPVGVYAEDKDDSRNPIGCRDVGYNFDMKTVIFDPAGPVGAQSMYFIFNILNEKVTLFQMHGNESSHNLYLNHRITEKKWAALSMTEKPVRFICTVPDENSRYGKIVDCGESIKICQFTKVRYGMNNKGSYWLVNSNTKNGALREVVRYGIIPGA